MRWLGGSGLAFTSRSPGCTQSINFYRMDDGFRFVDLPGMDIAKVPKEITRQWKQLIEHYLPGTVRCSFRCLILDARRGWMDKDIELKTGSNATAGHYRGVPQRRTN